MLSESGESRIDRPSRENLRDESGVVQIASPSSMGLAGDSDSVSYEGTIRLEEQSQVSSINDRTMESEDSRTEEDDVIARRDDREREALAQLAREAERNNALQELEQELKDLIDKFDRAASPDEEAQLLRKIWEVQAKINGLRPPAGRLEDQFASRRYHSEPQSLSQRRGGELSRGAPGVGPTKAGSSSFRKLTKSDDQKMRAELERIKEELAREKGYLGDLNESYPRILFTAREDAGMIQIVRDETLAKLDRIDDENQARLASLAQLFRDGLINRQGQSINQGLLASVLTCRKDCTDFSGRLKFMKEFVRDLRLAEATRRQLASSSDLRTGQALGIRV